MTTPTSPKPSAPNPETEDLPPLPRPRWPFWVSLLVPVLGGGFTPFLYDVVGPKISSDILFWKLNTIMYVFFPVNLVGSFLAVMHLSRLRTGQARLGWLLIGTPLAFLMNAQLGYALAVLLQALTTAPPP